MLACFVCWKVVADDRPGSAEEKIDYVGVTTLSISLFGLLIALDLVVDFGFKSPVIVCLMAIFFVFPGLFIIVERRAGKDALIPQDVSNNQKFFAAGISTLLLSVVFFAALLYVPQILTKEHGYSAMGAGMGLLPMMVVFNLVSYVSGSLYERLSTKVIVSAGTICMCIGMFMFSHLHVDTTYTDFVPGLAWPVQFYICSRLLAVLWDWV